MANLWLLSIHVFTMWVYSGTFEVGALKSGSNSGNQSKIFYFVTGMKVRWSIHLKEENGGSVQT